MGRVIEATEKKSRYNSFLATKQTVPLPWKTVMNLPYLMELNTRL